jgi:hypothetical protein
MPKIMIRVPTYIGCRTIEYGPLGTTRCLAATSIVADVNDFLGTQEKRSAAHDEEDLSDDYHGGGNRRRSEPMIERGDNECQNERECSE